MRERGSVASRICLCVRDEKIGLETRIDNIKHEQKEVSDGRRHSERDIKESEALIKKYEEQQMQVRNNREYDALTKELEAQKQRIVDATRQVISGTDRRGVAAALRGMSERPDMTDQLPEIDVATLVICGQHDSISPVAEMQSLAEQIPNGQFVEIAAAGHMAPLEQPQRVNQVIHQFLLG